MVLTVQVLLLGPHDFMGRRLADGLGDGGAGDAVLSGGDPVRDALTRHPEAPNHGSTKNEHRVTEERVQRSRGFKAWSVWSSSDNTETTERQTERHNETKQPLQRTKGRLNLL